MNSTWKYNPNRNFSTGRGTNKMKSYSKRKVVSIVHLVLENREYDRRHDREVENMIAG